MAEDGPTPPGLEHVFSINARINPPRSNGPGVNGERKHIEIIGGTVSGPKLEGRILPGGSDWLWQRRDGTAEIQAHYTIEASDGTLIYVRNFGIRVAPEAVRKAMIAGPTVDPTEYYFRSSPSFDVPDGPHQWLRERIFVCSLVPGPGQVTIDVFCLG